jgi:hypothetical protein
MRMRTILAVASVVAVSACNSGMSAIDGTGGAGGVGGSGATAGDGGTSGSGGTSGTGGGGSGGTATGGGSADSGGSVTGVGGAYAGIIFYRDPDGNYKDWHSLRPATGITQVIAAMTPELAPIDANRVVAGHFSASLRYLSAGTTKPIFNCGDIDCLDMSVSPNGSLLAFQFRDQLSTDQIEIVSLDVLEGLPTPPVGLDILKVPGIEEAAGYRYASWAPDGALFVADGTSLARVQNGLTTVLKGLSGPGAPTFSPDGQKMAFIMLGGDSQVYVANRDGTGLKQLTTFAHAFESVAWSPFGDVLVATVAIVDKLGNPANKMVYVKMDGSVSNVQDSAKTYLHADVVFWLKG